MKREKMTTIQAIYLAGVAFSFGIRLGQIPMFGPNATSPIEGVAHFAVSFLFSLLSWFGAGLALGKML